MRRLELMVGLLRPGVKAERQAMLLLLLQLMASLYYYYYYHHEEVTKLQVAVIYETLGIKEAKGTHLELEVVS
mgnify:CR=1 FL=1